MTLIFWYVGFMVAGDVLAYLLGGIVEYQWGSQASLVVLEVTQNKPVSVKAGGTKAVNTSINCPSGTTVVGSGSSAGP